jgi:transposase
MKPKSDKGREEEKEFRIDQDELEALSARIAERKLEADDWQRVHQYLVMLLKLTRVLEQGRVRMRKLLRILFGKRTEKDKPDSDKPAKGPNSPPPASPSAGAGKPDTGAASTASGGQVEPDSEKQNASSKGHGRHPASAYENAPETLCSVCGNKAGDRCPACGKGTLRNKEDEIVIRIKGSAPVTAEKYRIEKLRCDTCGVIWKGKLPEQAGEDKYQASAKVSIVMMKYASGLPFYRLEKQQAYQQIPLPASTQWELVEEVADAVLPVYLELERLAAQAELLFIDDTWNLVLEENKKQHTTGVVAQVNNHWVTLYLTGSEAAGRKVLDLLQQRGAHLPRPLQMSDALACNYPDPLRVVVLLCWIHARRQFFEIKDFYPQECTVVLDAIGKLYWHEEQIRELQLDDAARRLYHQQHSQPMLEQMKKWLQDQQNQRLIEPNSVLGKAAQYLNTHWDGLMGFCRYLGAPLDNNIVERILKDTILIRKNAYFFKTNHGANVGSLLMSLIKTATQAGANPFSYLEALLQHRRQLRQNVELWLPWNYRSPLRT